MVFVVRLSGILLGLVPLTGCASVGATIFDRPMVGEHPNLKKPFKITAISGDRRLAKYYKLTTGWLVCAEPFSGGEIARAGNTELTVRANLTGKDGTTETLTPIDARSSVDRLYQDQSHDLCSALGAGLIGPSDYFDQLKHVQDQAWVGVKAQAEARPDTGNPQRQGSNQTSSPGGTDPQSGSGTTHPGGKLASQHQIRSP